MNLSLHSKQTPVPLAAAERLKISRVEYKNQRANGIFAFHLKSPKSTNPS